MEFAGMTVLEVAREQELSGLPWIERH